MVTKREDSDSYAKLVHTVRLLNLYISNLRKSLTSITKISLSLFYKKTVKKIIIKRKRSKLRPLGDFI
jgi:hypothetical protein